MSQVLADKTPAMSPAAFDHWCKTMGWTSCQAAIELGCSLDTVRHYRAGRTRGEGLPRRIPRTVALACAALFHRLEPWTAEPPDAEKAGGRTPRKRGRPRAGK